MHLYLFIHVDILYIVTVAQDLEELDICYTGLSVAALQIFENLQKSEPERKITLLTYGQSYLKTCLVICFFSYKWNFLVGVVFVYITFGSVSLELGRTIWRKKYDRLGICL